MFNGREPRCIRKRRSYQRRERVGLSESLKDGSTPTSGNAHTSGERALDVFLAGVVRIRQREKHSKRRSSRVSVCRLCPGKVSFSGPGYLGFFLRFSFYTTSSNSKEDAAGRNREAILFNYETCNKQRQPAHTNDRGNDLIQQGHEGESEERVGAKGLHGSTPGRKSWRRMTRREKSRKPFPFLFSS